MQARTKTLVALVAVSTLAIVGVPTTSASGATVPSGFTDSLVASGLTRPTALAVANDGRVFVAQQSGAVRVIKNGALLPTPFVTLTVKDGGAAGEEGLVGITLDPSFATNNRVYVYYTVPTAGTAASHNRVSRYTASGDVAAGGSHKLMLDLPGPSSPSGNGGGMHFGTDGKLYIGVGDHGSGANGQSMSTIKGKLLRLNSDGSTPHDNPFFSTAVSQNRLIWALGLRNPSRFGVQPGTGKILVNDAAADGSFEEIDLGGSGANFGWNVNEGPTGDPQFRSPLFSYPHQPPLGAPAGCAIGGGAFYNPTTAVFPASYVGKYFFGDGCAGSIRVLDPATGVASDFASDVGQPVDLQVGNDGALYYLDRLAGSVRRISFSSADTAPSITTQPVSVTVAEGQPASFSVSAEGTPPLAYQWQRDGDDILGANSAVFTMPSTALGDSGASFSAVVTNGIGAATSAGATLTVTPSGGGGGGGGGGGTFSDAFDRPNSSDLGSGWLEVSGDLSISAMELRSAPTKNLFQVAIVPGFSSATQTVAASFARVDSNSTPRFGVVLRYQDAQNYYLMSRRTGGSSLVQISRIVNGTETVLGTKSLPNPVVNTLFRLEGGADGTTLTLKVDGAQMLSVSDATFTAGQVGLGLGSLSTSVGAAHRADNFSASGSDGTVVPTLALTAAPAAVAVDASSTLNWSTTGADTCGFTSGLTGARPVTGNESTGALTSTTTFSMTCTGAGGTVSKSVTVTVGGAPPVAGQLPSAADVFSTETMDLPSSVRSFVFLVPNESHHNDVTRLISPKNGWLLPMKVTVPAGATVSVVNADNGHPHSLTVRSGATPVFATGTLAYGALSTPASLAAGGYTLIDDAFSWIHGDVTVGSFPSDGTLLVGAFFLPANRLADYRSLFPANGFQIESEYAFSHGGKQQILLVFSTNEDLSTAGPKLGALVKANSYG